MKNLLWPCLTLLTIGVAHAESFDVASFTPLPGYTRSTFPDRLELKKVSGGQYCVLAVYSSVPSAGSVSADFAQDWAELVTPGRELMEEPQTEAGTARNAWENRLGAAKFRQGDGLQGVALLSTYSGYGKRLSLLLLGNDAACLSDLQTFMKGLTLSRPAATATRQPAVNPAPTSSVNPALLRGEFSQAGASMTQYVNAYTGAAAPTSGTGRTFNFKGDGTFEMYALIQNTFYSCTKTFFSNRSGEYKVQGNTLTLTFKKGEVKLFDSCYPNTNKTTPATIPVEKYSWRLVTDPALPGVLTLELTDGKGQVESLRQQK